MRTRATNILQMVVLLTGLVYLCSGVIFFSSPFLFGKIIGVQTSDEWLNQIRLDEFIIMIYMMARGLSAMLIVVGISMIMPLFDPLKYRIMIYLNGVIFPLMASVFLIYSGLSYSFMAPKIVGGAFGVVFVAHLAALLLTKANAKKGIE